ncbi:MAG: recombinase family protein [Cetobacterium sp.]
MKKVYGYCRMSHRKHVIKKQIENILKAYPEAKLFPEVFSETIMERKEWIKLKDLVKAGDTIVFDSVSRMSRNSDEGILDYMYLLDRNINLVFLKEPYINTEIYIGKMKANNVQSDYLDLNETIIKGFKEYLKRLVTKQIIIAFDLEEKEIINKKQRTREGMAIAKANGSIIGRSKGDVYETKKSKLAKKKILKYSKEFGGNMNDKELMEDILKIARNSYYKYKKELIQNRYQEPLPVKPSKEISVVKKYKTSHEISEIQKKVEMFLIEQPIDFFKDKNNKKIKVHNLFTRVNYIFENKLEYEDYKSLFKIYLSVKKI